MTKLEDLTWLTGRWKGKTKDGVVEEHWSGIEVNTMIGMFRWIKENKLFIFESMALVQRGNEIKLYLRHFDDSYKGWEKRENPMIYGIKDVGQQMVAFEQQSKMDESYIKYTLDSDQLKFDFFDAKGELSFALNFNNDKKIHLFQAIDLHSFEICFNSPSKSSLHRRSTLK